MLMHFVFPLSNGKHSYCVGTYVALSCLIECGFLGESAHTRNGHVRISRFKFSNAARWNACTSA